MSGRAPDAARLAGRLLGFSGEFGEWVPEVVPEAVLEAGSCDPASEPWRDMRPPLRPLPLSSVLFRRGCAIMQQAHVERCGSAAICSFGEVHTTESKPRLGGHAINETDSGLCLCDVQLTASAQV